MIRLFQLVGLVLAILFAAVLCYSGLILSWLYRNIERIAINRGIVHEANNETPPLHEDPIGEQRNGRD